MLEVDGSLGEGGGQVLRTSLSLACILSRSIRIRNIRSGRKKPGLQPQHLMAVKAAAAVSGAAVEGAAIGSRELTFIPSAVTGGDFTFDIGTAGAAPLVLQTVLPPLLLASSRPSVVTVTGGTHVPMSPSATYMEHVFLPALRKLGHRVDFRTESWGFYPRGGGRIVAQLTPGETAPLRAGSRGYVGLVTGISAVANLPREIASRQRRSALDLLTSSHPEIPAAVELKELPSPGQGTFIFLKPEGDGIRAGFTALGERGKRAEIVGAEAAGELVAWVETGAAVDPHLADQLVIWLALADVESLVSTSCITRHLLTNLEVVRLFHPFDYHVAGKEGDPGLVTIRGIRPFPFPSRRG